MNARVAAPSAMASEARWVLPALGSVYVIWGSTYLAIRIAVVDLPPLLMASSRFILSGGVLLVALKLWGAAWPSRREWLWAVPIGTLMFALGNGTVTVAEKSISSGLAAVVCATMPLIVAALGPFFGERATPREWFALLVGFLGVGVLGLNSEVRADPASAALVAVSPVSWAIGSLLLRRLPQAKGPTSSATQMIAGGAVMALLGAAMGERVPSSAPLPAVLAWAYLTVFGSLIGYSAYTYLLRHTRPALATSHSYVNPALAVGLGAALGGEEVGTETVVSVALIILATALLMRSRRG